MPDPIMSSDKENPRHGELFDRQENEKYRAMLAENIRSSLGELSAVDTHAAETQPAGLEAVRNTSGAGRPVIRDPNDATAFANATMETFRQET